MPPLPPKPAPAFVVDLHSNNSPYTAGLRHDLTDDEIAVLFKSLDTDANGEVSSNEVAMLFARLHLPLDSSSLVTECGEGHPSLRGTAAVSLTLDRLVLSEVLSELLARSRT